jgi:branched-chain amino acid transport system permease protein
LPYELAVLTAILVPLALGLLVGFISLRIDGMYLAIATLIVGEIMRTSFVQLTGWTNGASGRGLGYPVLLLGKLDRSSTFSLIAIVLVLMMVVTHNIIRGRTGRALVAMRGSASAAQAMGINLVRHRLLAFGLATIYAAVAGVMWASYSTRIYPTEWSLSLSLNILAVVVVGGIKSIWGTVLGSLVIYSSTTIIADLAQKIPNYQAIKSQLSGLPSIFTGVLIIVVIIVYPYGLIYIGKDLKRLGLWLSKLTKKHAGDDSPPASHSVKGGR